MKLTALRTLVRHELDIEKLTFYTRELERVYAELRAVKESLRDRQIRRNVLPFRPQKPPRSA